ncbi:unnamed protein product [Urochloa humidicola]
MDCILLSSWLPSHSFVSSRYHQGSNGLNSIGFAVIRKGCLKLRCYAIGDELGGPGRINHPFNGNSNGPIFPGLNASGASFRTVGAEITQETGDFFVSDAGGDPDKPTDGFSSIDQAVNALREGKGDIGDGEDVLVRVHSECLTGDILGSARCDCGEQLELAMQLIEKAGRGVLVYLRGHEGRGIGLGQKLRAYNLQDEGHDTVEANVELGLAVDAREYGIGAQILRDIGVRTMRLMTNNPAKFIGLKGYELAVVGRVPVISPITKENQKYLETKRTKMGHVYGSDLPGSVPEFGNQQDTAAPDKDDDTQN